jgi:hypothetical protein
MIDDPNQDHPSLKDRAGALFAMVGTGFVLNIALIGWGIYQKNWWITGIAVVIGIVMLWQAWSAYRGRKPGE